MSLTKRPRLDAGPARALALIEAAHHARFFLPTAASPMGRPCASPLAAVPGALRAPAQRGGDKLRSARPAQRAGPSGLGEITTGPTENTVRQHVRRCAAEGRCRRIGAAAAPIPRPTCSTLICSLLPVGVPGEPAGGAACSSRPATGNRPELTAVQFIQFFGKTALPHRRPGTLATRTGISSSSGAIDEQVKIRGFRIEPRARSRRLSRGKPGRAPRGRGRG